jgi:hypothetical protein
LYVFDFIFIFLFFCSVSLYIIRCLHVRGFFYAKSEQAID